MGRSDSRGSPKRRRLDCCPADKGKGKERAHAEDEVEGDNEEDEVEQYGKERGGFVSKERQQTLASASTSRSCPLTSSAPSIQRQRQDQPSENVITEEISDLKGHINELHLFIIHRGLLSELPQSIRDQIDSNGSLAKEREKILHQLIDETKRSKSLSCPSMSNAMLLHLGQIEELSNLRSGAPLACRLLVYAGIKPLFGDIISLHDKLKFNRQADALLFTILKRVREDETFDHVKLLNELEPGVVEMMNRGAQSYFLRSYAYLRSWKHGPTEAQKYSEVCRNAVKTSTANFEENLFAYGNSTALPRDIWKDFESNLRSNLASVRMLGYLEGGPMLAFKLVLFLGRQSYRDLEPSKIRRFSGMQHLDLDPAADELLTELAKTIREEHDDFQFRPAAEQLHEEIDHLKTLDINTYFQKSYNLLVSWIPDLARVYAKEFRDEIDDKITTKFHAVQESHHSRELSPRRLTARWLKREMATIWPQIREMSERPLGLAFAIDLTIHGEHSYYTCYSQDISGVDNNRRRISDRTADDFLFKLFERARKERQQIGTEFEWSRYRDSIRDTRVILDDLGINGYFPRSYKWLGLYLPADQD